jgi:hypothetical protein
LKQKIAGNKTKELGVAWRGGAVDIISTEETEDLGSNSTRVKGF